MIAGDSCFPSLLSNDRVIADKQAYRSVDPQLGDQIVFSHPNNRKLNWVKRVIALAGDTVEIRDGIVMVNGVELATSVLEDNVATLGVDKQGRIAEEAVPAQTTLPYFPSATEIPGIPSAIPFASASWITVSTGASSAAIAASDDNDKTEQRIKDRNAFFGATPEPMMSLC